MDELNASITMNQVKELLKSKSTRITFGSIKSEHANTKFFKQIVLDGIGLNFTICHSCFTDEKRQSIVVVSGIKLYDGQFSRHVNNHHNSNESSQLNTIDRFLGTAVRLGDKSKMVDLLAKLCSHTMISYSMITSPAIVNFLTEFSKILYSYPDRRPQIADLIPHRTTIAEHVKSLAQKVDINCLIDELAVTGGCVVMDFGKNVHDYLCLFLHRIDNDWKLKVDFINFKDVPGTKATEDIKFHLNGAFFGKLEALNSNVIGMSDEGSNVTNAINESFHLGVTCVLHVFNTIEKHIFEPYIRKDIVGRIPSKYRLTEYENQLIVEAKQLISNTSTLAGQMKSKKFDTANKAVIDVVTRFHSKLACLESVKDILDKVSLDDLKLKVKAPSAQPLIAELRLKTHLMEELIKVLDIFSPLFLKLQSENEITSTEVLRTYYIIERKLLKIMEDEHQMTKALAKSALAALSVKKGNFHNDVWILAHALDPAVKKFNGIDSHDVLQVKKLLRKYAKVEKNDESAAKKARNDDEFFGDPIQIESESDEVDDYMNSPCERTAPLEYWQRHEEKYPKLAKLARKILSVPASSASVERAFSSLRRLIGDNRTLLAPESVSNLLKIHYSQSS